LLDPKRHGTRHSRTRVLWLCEFFDCANGLGRVLRFRTVSGSILWHTERELACRMHSFYCSSLELFLAGI
jgi:hypothetical protein